MDTKYFPLINILKWYDALLSTSSLYNTKSDALPILITQWKIKYLQYWVGQNVCLDFFP